MHANIITTDFETNCKLVLTETIINSINEAVDILSNEFDYAIDVSRLSNPSGIILMLANPSNNYTISILSITSSIDESINLVYYEVDKTNIDTLTVRRSADYVSSENFLEQVIILMNCENTIVS